MEKGNTRKVEQYMRLLERTDPIKITKRRVNSFPS